MRPPHETLVSGFFPARNDLRRAVRNLRAAGLGARARVLPRSGSRAGDLGVRAATKAAEGAALGAAFAGLSGALAGALFAGGAVVVPGVGAVLAGPLPAALAGAGAAGAIGFLVGALVGARWPEYEVSYGRDAVDVAGAVVAVACLEGRAPDVEEILVSAGGLGVRRRSMRGRGS